MRTFQFDHDERLWALVFPDAQGRPRLAHLVVLDEGEYKTTACGQVLYARLHGFWRLPAGELPLQERWIHCNIGDALR